MHSEKTISSELIYKGRIIDFRRDEVELENGEKAIREVVSHPGGVCVVAIDENENVFLVEQFRYPYMKELLEIPAGKLDRGEDPFEAAKRELLEETGVVANSYMSLGQLYPSPGYFDEIIYMYMAKDLEYKSQSLDEDEFLTVKKMPIKDLVYEIMNGNIPDSKTQAAVLKASLILNSMEK